ncbi:Transposase [Popillia japonica]|uniref:Transposase n=1 Tax=Popillia japonica TaxID=7064 RepID=A0AAW1JV80_POPJA
MDHRVTRTIIRRINAQPRLTARSIENELKKSGAITVHPETAHKCLRSEGLHSRTPRKEPLVNAASQTKRLKFAKRYHRVHESDFRF